jgi:hypothetical protein
LSYRHGHEATVFEPNALMHKSVGPTWCYFKAITNSDGKINHLITNLQY